jgi:N-acetylneuraminate synthase
MYKKPIIIAEIGCNHKGSYYIAKKMIISAKKSGASYVKFQKRDNRYLLGNRYYEKHPVYENSFGKNYGEHRDYLEFNLNQHKRLIKFCKKVGIKYATSVWEKNSALQFIKIQKDIDYLKVPSACNLDFELLKILAEKFKKKIHVSLGMTKKDEIDKILKFFKKKKRSKDLIIYQCCSSYPAKFDDLNLLNIKLLKEKYKNYFSEIAFSGHHLGISADIAAYTLGANIIERHFTLDRTLKGTDHAASLEPDGLKKLCRDLYSVSLALKLSLSNKILKNEVQVREKLKVFRD